MLLPIYVALEAAGHRHGADPLYATLYHPDVLGGWQVPLNKTLQLSWTRRSTRRASLRRQPVFHWYKNKSRPLRRPPPLLLVAHAYTRYLGDLVGGAAAQTGGPQGLRSGTTAFYEFGAPGGQHVFKAALPPGPRRPARHPLPGPRHCG